MTRMSGEGKYDARGRNGWSPMFRSACRTDSPKSFSAISASTYSLRESLSFFSSAAATEAGDFFLPFAAGSEDVEVACLDLVVIAGMENGTKGGCPVGSGDGENIRGIQKGIYRAHALDTAWPLKLQAGGRRGGIWVGFD